MGIQILLQEGGNFGVVRPIEKHCESLLRCTQQTLITALARLLQPPALLPLFRCHINFFPWKICPKWRTSTAVLKNGKVVISPQLLNWSAWNMAVWHVPCDASFRRNSLTTYYYCYYRPSHFWFGTQINNSKFDTGVVMDVRYPNYMLGPFLYYHHHHHHHHHI